MQISGSHQLVEQIQKRDLCVRCGACVGLCPYFKTHKGMVVMTFSCDREQGRCHAYCPRTPVDYEQLSLQRFGTPYEETPLGTYRKITASKAGPAFDSQPSQNGGTVSALLAFAMEKGLIDGAVVTEQEQLIPKPEIKADVAGIKAAATTKYMASPTVAKVNDAVTQGFQKLGVVGTPCQMTAIAKMRTNPLGRKDFKDPTALLIGLFCTWAVDTRQLISLAAEKTDIATIIGMDIPPPPAEIFILKTTTGEIRIPLDEIRSIIPKGCRLCPDMTCEWADVSVGAFEGRSGWNTLIIRTQKGEDLVNGAVAAGYLVLDTLPEMSISHLSAGARNKKQKGLANQKKEDAFQAQNRNTKAPAAVMVGFR